MIWPIHKILVIMAYDKSLPLNMHAQLSSEATCLIFGLSLLSMSLLNVRSNQSSGETAFNVQAFLSLHCL